MHIVWSFQTIAKVVGHLDYSFASAWHPDGRIFATGNQDKTSRVWDIRNLSSPIAVLKNNLGACRSIRFSSDGQFMIVAEPADFVHIYSTTADYQKRQEIDFFGEISGVSASPDDESLYIGIWDRTYASLLQYNRRHTYGYLDSYFWLIKRNGCFHFQPIFLNSLCSISCCYKSSFTVE